MRARLGKTSMRLGKFLIRSFTNQGIFNAPHWSLTRTRYLSVVKEEQFGPILPLAAFDTEDEAIAMANDDPFGLASSVRSTDMDRAVSLSRRIEAGYSFVNAHGPSAKDNNGPFDG